MRILFFLFLFAIQTFPQFEYELGKGSTFNFGQTGVRNTAIDLNGTDEYAYRTYSANDSLLNMNGYERIQNANTTGFESSTGTWTNPAGSNTTITRNTSSPLFGAGDGLIIATGAGDSVTNYVGIPISTASLHGTTAGSKYTVEFWYKHTHAAEGDQDVFRWGNNTKSFNATSTSTKAVFNFESTSYTALEDTIKFYTTSATGDTLQIDSVNISQAYDFVIEGWIYQNTGSSGNDYIINFYGSNAGAGNFYAILANNGTLTSTIIVDALTKYTLSKTFTLSNWHYIHATYQRDGNGGLYIDGVGAVPTSMSNVGRLYLISAVKFGIGDYMGATGSGFGFNGYIGETRVTRFTNIGSSNWTTSYPLTTYNTYKKQFADNLTGGGKTTVAWYKWQGDSNLFLDDLSGNAYDLTGNNVTISDRIKWRK